MTYETTTTDLEDHGSDQRSPRKSIPPQWMAKTKGPLLATAQRAKEREARKQKPHSESPIGSGMKTIRGARSSIDLGKLYGTEQTTFLTKNAAAAVESDITSQSATRTPKALRHTPSKGVLKTPTGSPVRESPGKHSAVKTTVLSPTRSIVTHEFGLDGVSQSIAMTTTDASPHSPSVVSSAGSTPFVSAKQSPVSPGSVPKFVTANVSHDFQILDLDLADADGIEQMTKSEHGMKSFQSTHSRGKSEPHARVAFAGCKATSSKPRIPKLSLRIPNSSSLSTDRRPPFILGSASSSGPGTPVSPSQSSRIPRIFVPTKNEQECSITSTALQSGATLRRSTSVKTLVAEKATRPTHTIVKSSRPALRATIVNYDSTECRSSAAFVDPHDVPLPETTVVPSLRHVRTVDSMGATPILSQALAASVDEALSSVSPCSSTIGEEITVTNTTPIGDSLVQGNEDKHRRVKSYLEFTEQMEKPPISPLPGDIFSTWIEPKCMTVPITLPAAGATEKLDELQTATREFTAERPKMYTSISTSAATMKDTTIERDPAIIFHRKKLDASGMIPIILNIPVHVSPLCVIMTCLTDLDSSISDPVLDRYASSTTSTSTGISRPSENRFDTVPTRTGGQEHSEPSQESNFASNLRATAPVFQPQQHSKPLAETQSGPPPNIIQQQQPIVLFDPFALDMNGIPWYHYMYPVPISPYRKKGKNRKYVGPKSRGYTNNSSPTTAVRSDDTQAATRLIQATDQAQENPVSELMDTSPGKVKDITVSSPMLIPGPPIKLHSKELSANIKRSSQTTSPFATQMDSVTRQDLVCNDGGLGRTKTPIDWSSIHNVPSGFQSRSSHLPPLQDSRVACLEDPQANVHPGFGRTRQPTYSQQYPGRQPYHRRPGSNGLYDNFSPAYQGRNPRAAAGVPLHATAPFPTPLPPPGPRIRVGYSTRKEYGYRAPAKKEPCGEMIIESAVEWGGGPMCNKCAESDGER